ncbi:ethanolamine utilization protein EutQ [Roseovarius sp. C7]|uniref:ethanolamine utilization protein EutQ n=1 Tax=Roseovarius sp. C7 TaxID=3398643 RepID=UPI0039F6A327
MSQPRSIPFDSLTFVPRFAYGEMAQAAEVAGSVDDTELGAGFVRMSRADIPWQIKYDEVILVLEGEIEVVTEAGVLSAGPRDCLWLPKGTELRYRSDEALVFYAITPADWAAREGLS